MKNEKEFPWIFMQISQITWEICEEKSLKIWGEKRKLLARSSECSTSWWGNSTFSRNFVESLLKNPPWLHNDIRMFNTLWKSEIGKFIFRLVTKWYMPLECYISPIKNVCLINIRKGIDFPNTRTLLYDICYNLLWDAEIENFDRIKTYEIMMNVQ
jgi:hypothetical protein